MTIVGLLATIGFLYLLFLAARVIYVGYVVLGQWKQMMTEPEYVGTNALKKIHGFVVLFVYNWILLPPFFLAGLIGGKE